MTIGSFGLFDHDSFSDEPAFPTNGAPDGHYFKAACLRILANCIFNGNVSVLRTGLRLYSKLKEGRVERCVFVDEHKNKTEEELSAFLSDPIQAATAVAQLGTEALAAAAGSSGASPASTVPWLAKVFELDAQETEVLAVLAQLRYNGRIRRFVDETLGRYPDVRTRRGFTPVSALAVTAGIDPEVLQASVAHRGSLVSKGIAVASGGGRVNDLLVRFSDVVERILLSPDETDHDEFVRILLGEEAETARFALADFPQVGETSSVALLVRASLPAEGRREKGVNILICGPSGSGKSEFVRSLAAAVDARLCHAGRIDVSEMPDARHGPHDQDRLARFLMSRVLARRLGRVVLVVDNAEEVLSAVPWKAGVEKLLDENDVVTVWITENPNLVPRHAVRRMVDVVEFGKPSKTVRTDIAKRLVKDADLPWDEKEIARLVELDVSASMMKRGVRSSSLSTRRIEKAVSTIEALGRRLGSRRPPKPIRSRFGYDLSLVHADADLAVLADRIAVRGRVPVSFCFYGMPGTGKTAFAHHLATRLDMPLVEKRASDLLGRYVGESEQKIADAFEEARNEEAFLVINEADSFLQDRRFAHQNWEVGIVNEMLTWMESHPLPFAMSTNLMSRLDPASLRRFLFKVRFHDMTPDQVLGAFRSAFGTDAPKGFERTRLLTPGDFALVCRQTEVLGVTDPAKIARMLEEEVAMKIASDPEMRVAAEPEVGAA